MAQIITRLFSSDANAAAAIKDLEDYRFGENEVMKVDGGADAQHDDLVAMIVQAGISKSDAAVYAEKVKAGSTLVVVHAPFGAAHKATVLLDRHQPLPAVVEVAPAPRRAAYEKSAPLSSLFQWPSLSSNSAPLSSFFGWSTLSQYSMSRAWGYSELSDNPAPLSKALGWSTLSETSAPLSAKMKWRLLSDEPAPLSKRLNWGMLSSNPTPLSSLLGVHVLSRHR